MLHGSTREWITFWAVFVACLLLDTYLIQRLPHSFPVHLGLLLWWLAVGAGYAAYVCVARNWHQALYWLTGYSLEWLLSVDNLLFFGCILRLYRTPRCLRRMVLFYGLRFAVLIRLYMFLDADSTIRESPGMKIVFGAALMLSGAQAFFRDDADADDEGAAADAPAVRLVQRCLGSRVHEMYDLQGQRFLVVRDEKWCVTPLVPVLLAMELSDALFAVDSVTAKVAAIPDRYLAFSSTMLATIALRSAFFVLGDLVRAFSLLKYGVGFSLTFVGVELILAQWLPAPEWLICSFVVVVFLVCALASLAQMALRSGG